MRKLPVLAGPRRASPRCGPCQGFSLGCVPRLALHADGDAISRHFPHDATLVCSDLMCEHDAITTTYKKRWQVQVFHNSLKSNAGMAKSPTQTLRTQSKHVFMAIYAVFKLRCLSVISKRNPFALRFKLLINATRSAFDQLQKFQADALGQ